MSLAAQIRNYTIAGTMGFPEQRKESNMGPKGACVLPNTLKSNVRNLHAFLFGDEEYEVSSQVRDIDNRIATDEANYKARAAASKEAERESRAKKEEEEEEEDKSKESGEGDEDASGASRTRATDEDGNEIVEEFDDPDGEILGPLETDEDGNVVVSTIGNSAPTAASGGRVAPFPTESGAASRENDETIGNEGPSGSSVKPGGSTTAADDAGSADGPARTTASSRNEPGPVVTDETVNAGPGSVSTTAAQTAAAQTTAAAPGPGTEPVSSPGPSAAVPAPAVSQTTAAAVPPADSGPSGVVGPVSPVPGEAR